MLKIVLRTVIILLVTGLVAGGIYLFVENGGASSLGAGETREGISAGIERGAGFVEGEMPARPEGEGGRHAIGAGGREGEEGFSLLGLSGVAMQIGKIAVITALVAVVQAVVRLFKRRPASTAAA